MLVDQVPFVVAAAVAMVERLRVRAVNLAVGRGEVTLCWSAAVCSVRLSEALQRCVSCERVVRVCESMRE